MLPADGPQRQRQDGEPEGVGTLGLCMTTCECRPGGSGIITLLCCCCARPPCLQTLLDVLAGRKNAGVTEGLVSFGGQKPTPQFLRRYTGYVEQVSTLCPGDVLTTSRSTGLGVPTRLPLPANRARSLTRCWAS